MKNEISDQLAALFNISFSSVFFSTTLKTSKVIVIYTKDSKLKCSNYRLISLLSNIDKILERIVYNYLYKLFEYNKLIFNLQFGLERKQSDSRALIYLTEKNCEQLDSEKYDCGIIIDFQKAFDTGDHTLLKQWLYHESVILIFKFEDFLLG